jgi:hypothetical protein
MKPLLGTLQALDAMVKQRGFAENLLRSASQAQGSMSRR